MSANKKGFYNDYKIIGDTTIVYIPTRKGGILELLIDTEELPKLIEWDYPWYARYSSKVNTYYANHSKYIGKVNGKKVNNKTIILHRLLVDAEENDFVDHKNHNGLDDRKKNLEITTNAINSQNRCEENNNSNTGYLNVSYIESVNQYWVQFMKNGKKYKKSFSSGKFKEACAFAKIKRKELFENE